MIGQQADALLVGDAKQRSALYAFLRSVDPGCVVGGAVRVAAYFARGRRRAVRLSRVRARGVAVRRGFEVGALDADVGRLLARVHNTAVHIKDLSLGKLEHAATPGTALGVERCRARASALCVAAERR
jgi:hypothetical protein